MAIKKTGSDNDSITLKLDNGDFKVLNLVKQQWGFKDEESLLRFAIAILFKAENRAVTIKDSTGSEISLKPTADLLEK